MEKETFNGILAHPCRISNGEWPIMHRMLKDYPYCSLLQMFDLLGSKACGALNIMDGDTYRVALYMMDPTLLDKLLNQVSNEPYVPEPPAQEAPKQVEAAEETNGFDIMQEINSYQEVSFKTAPKSIILSKFLETNDYLAADIEGDNGSVTAETDKKSIKEDSTICSETLAVILEKQGKFAKAIAVYENLMSKYPEKKSTFANQIEFLTNKMKEAEGAR